MTRARRWLWRLPLLIILVPLLLLALLLGVANVPAAQRALAGLISDMAGDSLSVGGIDGFVPVDFRVTDVALSDEDGVWMTLDHARLAWSPGALFAGRLEVEALTGGTAHVRRPPLPGPEAPPPEPAEPFRLSDLALPDLPVAVRLDRLAVDEIRLDEPVLGTAAAFTLSATARLPDEGGGLMADLDLERLDAPGTIALDLSFVPETGQLSLNLTVEEPAGGLVARAASLPGLPPVSVSLSGEGPITDWRARLQAEAGPQLGAEGTIGLQETEAGMAITPDLTARVTALTEESLDPLVAGGLGLVGTITYGEAGDIGWEGLRVTAPAGNIATSGSLGPEGETLSASLQVEAGPADAFAGLLPPGAGWSRLTLEAEAEGSMDDLTASAALTAEGLSGPAAAEGEAGPAVQSLRLALTADGPALQPDIAAALSASGITAGPDIRVESLQVDLQADPLAPLDQPDARVEVDLDAVARGADLGDPALAPLLQPEITLAVAGTLGLDGSADPLSLTLTTPAAELTAEATAQNWGAEADAELQLTVPQLQAFADLAGMPLEGTVQLDLEAESEDGTLAAGLDIVLSDIATGIAQVDALLGERATLSGGIRAPPEGEGPIVLTGLSFDAAGTTLQSDRIALDEALEAGVTIDLPDLAAIDPTLAGAVSLTIRATGPLDDLTVHATLDATDLEAGGQSVPEATLEVTASDLMGTPQGTLSLDATWRDRPVSLDTEFVVEEEGVALSDLRLALAEAEITGELVAGFDGMASGSLSGTIPDLGTLGAVADLPLEGSADLSVDLAVVEGRQDVSATVELSQAALPGTAAIGSAQLSAEVTDALGTPALEANLTAGSVAAAGVQLSSLRVTANGDLESLATTIDAQGPEIGLETAATLDLAGEAMQIALSRLTARYQGEQLALAGPATITLAGPAVVIDGLVLTARDGSIRVGGRYDPGNYNLDVSIEQLPLSLAELAAPDMNLDGRLNGSLALRGSQAAPRASLDLRAGGVGLAALRAQGFGAIDVAVEGQWADGRMGLDATVTLPDDSTLRAELAVPLRMDPASGLPSVPANAQLDGRITGSIDLAVLNNMLATTADRVEGRAELDVALSGPIDNPQANGDIRLSNGLYENAQYGILLQDISLVLTAQRSEQFTVTELTASTPGGGRITGDGAVSLGAEEGMPIEVTLDLQDAHLIESEMLSAVLSGELALTGDLTADAALQGELTVEEAEFSIPRQMPSSVPTLDVREINLPPEMAARQREEEEDQPSTAFRLALDITVRAPGQVFIRGRGVDLELAGTLSVDGTADQPRITGQLNTRRGTLDLLGKRFVFERGQITFNGEAEIDPTLDLLATTEAEGITGGVQVSGRASDPSLSFVSTPSYPEDEILARLLFGKSPTELSAAQAIELASAAGELAGIGGGGTIMSRIRDTLQLDRLEIQETEGDGTALSAGRYVSDDVFVGVEQDLGEGTSRATVEVEITPNISVETDVGSDSSSRVGVNFEWEY